MNERLLQLRKNLGLSQEKFGKELGVTGAGISKIESGERSLTDTMVKLICSTYNVNEFWIQTGRGDMYNEDPDAEVDYLIGKFMADNNLFRKKVITGMMKLTDDQWEYIEKFAREVFEAEK